MDNQSPASRESSHALPSEVWRLAWPAITHMLLVTLVFLVDRLLLGHQANTSLASLQISSILVWTLYSVFTAFSAGTLAVVARSVGEGDRLSAARAALSSIVFAFGLGAVVTLAILVGLESALPRVFPDAGGEVLQAARSYLHIVLPVLPFAFVEASLTASLQASGDTRTPLRAGVFANAINLGVSLVLVFGAFGLPAMGIRGAAIGNAASTVAQCSILGFAIFSRRSPMNLRAAWTDLRLTETLRRLLRVSLPAYFEKVAYNGGYLLFVVIIARLGEAAMAANQAMVSIEAVCFLSADGFGVATGALVAQKLGAGKKSEARDVAVLGTRMAVALLTACGLCFAIAPRLLMRAFDNDPTIISMGASALIMTAIAQPFMAYATVVRMGLRGAGATSTVFLVTVIGTFFVRLPVAWLCAVKLDLGLTGIWMGSTADWAVQSAIVFLVFRRGGWQNKVV